MTKAKACAYLESREVDDAIDGRVGREDLVKLIFLRDIDLVEGRFLAAEELNAINGYLGGIIEVVDDNNVVAVLE